MKYLSIIIFTFIVSCSGQKKPALAEDGSNNNTKSFSLVLQDNYSGSIAPDTLLIKDSKALRKFFSKVNMTRKPGLPVPEVDFSKEMILIYCGGEQPYGQQVSLAIAEENDQELILRSSSKNLDKKSTSSVLISPFSVYKMPLTNKRITFKKEQ